MGRRKFWTKELEEEFAKDWKDKSIPTDELVSKYGKSANILKVKAYELGVSRKNVEFNECDIEKIKELYVNERKTTVEIAKLFNCSTSFLNKTLKLNNVEIRNNSEYRKIYNIDEEYFRNIDTQEKAYFLGFLYADGCNDTANSTVSIALNSKDVEILEEFKSCIGSEDRPIKYFKNKGSFNSNGLIARVSVTNKKMSNYLNNHGVVSNKTFKLTFPENLRGDLINHFIRGYFDGDGHVGKKGNRIEICIVGTENLLNGIKNMIIKEVSDIKEASVRIKQAKKESKIMELRMNGGNIVEKVLDYIYKDSSIHLSRKYKVYQEIKNRERNSWNTKVKKYGRRGRKGRDISEQVIEYLLSLESSETIKKDDLFKKFIPEERINYHNISNHIMKMKEIVKKENLNNIIEFGYGVVKVNK